MALTFRERLDWILSNREFKSFRQLSTASGVGATTLSGVLVREEKKGQGNSSLSADVLAKVAKVANVSPAWLATGDGSPELEEATLARQDRYHFAKSVVEQLVADGIPRNSASAAVGQVVFDEGERGSTALDLYRAASRIIRAQEGKMPLGVRKADADDFS